MLTTAQPGSCLEVTARCKLDNGLMPSRWQSCQEPFWRQAEKQQTGGQGSSSSSGSLSRSIVPTLFQLSTSSCAFCAPHATRARCHGAKAESRACSGPFTAEPVSCMPSHNCAIGTQVGIVGKVGNRHFKEEGMPALIGISVLLS